MEQLIVLGYTAFRRTRATAMGTLKTQKETDAWVGGRVRLRRLEMGLSQTEVGDHLGITFQQIQKYEKGANRIGAGRLQALAEILAVPVGYFFPDPAPDTADQSENQAEVLDLLHTPGAVTLLRDFAQITDPGVRRSVGILLASLANARDQDSDALSPPAKLPQ
jgi:transcriptional regulator with XRE-family HTH domain